MSNNSLHLAICVDGGKDIGYGHLIRSNALAEEILSRGHNVTVATTTPQPTQSVFPGAVEIVKLSSRGDPGPFTDWLETTKPNAVFTDSYLIDTEYQRAICDQAPLAVLQDDNRHAVCADLFINGNLYAPNLDYEFIGEEPKICLGTDYVPLRSEIRDRAEDDPTWRVQPERAIIIMGGSDTANLMPTAIRAFDGIDIHVDAIIGPGFSDAQVRSVDIVRKKVSADVSVTRDPDDLVERMFQADFAVSTSSLTTYELLALGTPIISIPVVDNQKPIARSLRDRGAACVLERSTDQEALERCLKMYLTNISLRKAHTELGQQLVDGRGTKRVANKAARHCFL